MSWKRKYFELRNSLFCTLSGMHCCCTLSGMHCCCTSLGYALLLSSQAIAGIQTPPPISEENLDSRNRLEYPLKQFSK